MNGTSYWITFTWFINLFISELIITSGGENIAPVPIENRIKKEAPFLSNVMVVGDQRNYLTCLVTMKVCVSQLGKLHFLTCSHLTFTFSSSSSSSFLFSHYSV